MMRAITLWQPWAWAVIWGGKDVENRPRNLGYVGEVAIHAGLTFDDRWAFDRIETITGRPLRRAELACGRIIGVVDIVLWRRSIEKEPSSPWEFGPWCALLRNPRPIARPVPVRGYQGTWTVPEAVEREVRAQLGGVA